ncbi:beta-lactamase class A [Cytobacillus horneckiae]|uniref:serine hydrolase n=2 Tax=Cytobacillus horneckiae TaxID=549687 RepID=UPI00203E3B53|nr:serine hydrolase [Cytobacillus horneckiae]MCM3180536.1 class A beta-lactamase-related serine hydrolase [Cytobacillus horneckiae]
MINWQPRPKKMDIKQLESEIKELAANLDGRASIYIESAAGVIDVNGHHSFSSASLIKVPILMAAFHQCEQNQLKMEEKLLVSTDRKVGGAGVLQALSNELSMKLIDLLTLMIIVSDNTATNILIERLGMENINKYIHSLGMRNTLLQRKMMDTVALENGIDNKTTAADMVYALKSIKAKQLFSAENSNKMLEILSQQQFLKLADGIDLEYFTVASKTGELAGVQHDCAIISSQQTVLYAAVLIDELTLPETGKKTLLEIGKRLNGFLKEQ